MIDGKRNRRENYWSAKPTGMKEQKTSENHSLHREKGVAER